MSFKPVSSDWLTYRRDDHLSAHCPTPGRITSPSIRWTLPLGGTLQVVVPVADGSSEILLCYGGVILRSTLEGRTLWRSDPRGFHGVACVIDLTGDGTLQIVTSNGHELFVLDAATGKVRWSHWIGPPEYYGVYASAVRAHRFFPERSDVQLVVPALHHASVLMFDFSSGVEDGRVLHTLTMDDAFHATTVIGDVDRDGTDEIVVTRLGSIAVFDPRTGRAKHTTTWETDGERRRGYGQIILQDIDNDGELELVVLANRVTRHIAVLDNDGSGRFTPLWDRLVEHIYPTDDTEVRYCLRALTDGTQHGSTEVIVSLFNDRGDGRWYTEFLDATSGEVKRELPDVIVDDVRESSDGAPTLLAHTAFNRMNAERGMLQQIRMDTGSPRVVWSREDSRFACRTIGQTQAIGKYRAGSFEQDTVWSDTDGWYVFNADNGLVHVADVSHQEHVLHVPEAAPVPRSIMLAAVIGDCMILSESSGMLTIVRGNNTSATIACGISLATDGHPVERPSPTPVVFTTAGETYIAAPDNGDSVALFVTCGSAAPQCVWRVAGRGRVGFDRVHHSVSIDDINGDGVPEILFAEPGPYSILTARSTTGAEIARVELPNQPSIAAGPRTGAYDWVVVHEGARVSAVISCYASMSMNSESSRSVDVNTGEILWDRSLVGEEREGVGFGAWGIMSADGTVGYFCAKAYLCVVDLRTGKLIRPLTVLTDLTREAMMAAGTFVDGGASTLVTKHDPFTAYGSVMLRDIDNDGELELFVMGCLGGFGVVNADGTTRWWNPASLTDVAYHMGGICDVDGDGACELGLGHAHGEFVCYDAGSGLEKWRLSLGSSTIDCATCDIDGDGRDEFVCRTTDGGLFAIGVDAHGTPMIKWSMRFDFSVGNPVIADIDGDGTAEILVVLGDGSLVAIA